MLLAFPSCCADLLFFGPFFFFYFPPPRFSALLLVWSLKISTFQICFGFSFSFCFVPCVFILHFHFLHLVMDHFISSSTPLSCPQSNIVRLITYFIPTDIKVLGGVDLKTLRAIRVLRPLKLVSGVPSKWMFYSSMIVLFVVLIFLLWLSWFCFLKLMWNDAMIKLRYNSVCLSWLLMIFSPSSHQFIWIDLIEIIQFI